MKNKVLLATAFLFCVLGINAQGFNFSTDYVLDVDEDTTDVTTINDIVKMQQKVLSNTNADEHQKKIWGHRSYFNLTWNNATMSSKEPTLEFKSDFGGAMQSGTSYGLHKKPIANTVKINLDYAWLDLGVNHFKAKLDKDGKCYDSSNKNGEYYNIPWDLEKFEGSYGMNIGPSITIAPFGSLNIKPLHYLKLNAYYHVGYNVSFLYMNNNKAYDINENGTGSLTMDNNLKLLWGHGMTKAYGISLFWRGIGVGVEHRTGDVEYQNINKNDFGNGKYKFTNSISRVYITFRT